MKKSATYLKPHLKPSKDERGFKAKEEGSKVEIFSISERIRTVDQAVKHGGYDLAVWAIKSSDCTSYESGLKTDDGVQVVQLWRIKVSLVRRISRSAECEAETLLDRIRKHAPKYGKFPPVGRSSGHMLELSMFDVHFGKLAWHVESGADYDLDITKQRYIDAVDDLLGRASMFGIEKIILPIGQDFFNIDNKRNETTAGTPQDCDGRYSKIWAYGKESAILAVESCARIAPTEVIYSPGNHDELSSYHLCDYLSAWFRHNKRVTVDASPKKRKYVQYGPVVIGFTHGNNEKHNDLVGIMLHEARELMAKSRTLEIHTGHFHKAKTTRFVNTDTHSGGVRLRILPSLSGTDSWHYDHGYVGSLQAAEGYLWSKKSGYAGHLSSNVAE